MILPAIVLCASACALSVSALAGTTVVDPVTGFVHATGAAVTGVGHAAVGVVGGVAHTTSNAVTGVAHTTSRAVTGVAHTTAGVGRTSTTVVHHTSR